MDQRVSIVTLGVRDLPKARAFYQQLGWQGSETQETVFFQAGGMLVILWGRDKLAADSGVADDDRPGAFDGIVLAQNLRSEGEVDELIAVAREAGATVTREPAPTFYGGYAGCFADPDGHLWEIAYNPGIIPADDGTITVPDLES
jgi:predicted lactoylglutathione lyase